MMRFLLVGLFLFLSACGHMPRHYETRSDDRPSILVTGAPNGAEVIVNEQRSGTVEWGKSQVYLSPGTHDVRIVHQGRVLFEQAILLEGNTRREIDLSKGN